MATEKITVSVEGMTVSRLVWRRFGKTIPGLVEAIFAKNAGLAELGPIIPVGTVVRVPIPDPIASRSEPDVKPIRLWS